MWKSVSFGLRTASGIAGFAVLFAAPLSAAWAWVGVALVVTWLVYGAVPWQHERWRLSEASQPNAKNGIAIAKTTHRGLQITWLTMFTLTICFGLTKQHGPGVLATQTAARMLEEDERGGRSIRVLPQAVAERLIEQGDLRPAESYAFVRDNRGIRVEGLDDVLDGVFREPSKALMGLVVAAMLFGGIVALILLFFQTVAPDSWGLEVEEY